jgi:hypothetical protein
MCFVASLVLWVLSYFHQRYHLLHVLRKAPVAGLIRIPARMYYFAHFGGLNFSFDLPGASVPSVKLSRFLVCAINVCAGVIVVFTTFVIEPFTKAWGCYAPYDDYTDYIYGMCPAYFSNDAARLQPVCDQPGDRCGNGVVYTQHTLHRAQTIAIYMTAVSVSFYLLSIQPKVVYYNTQLLRALEHPKSVPEKLKAQ